MKSPHILFITSGILSLAIGAVAAQPVLVRVSADTITRLQQRDPMLRLETPKAGTHRIVRPQQGSVIKESTILHDGTHWTLVPNGAVVHLPATQSERINARPVGSLMPWPEFLANNSGWLTTREVSFDQAAGNESIDPAVLSEWKTGDKVVIAVHRNGPIQVKLNTAEKP